MTKMIIFLAISMLIWACEKNEIPNDTNPEELIGYWTNPEVNDTIWTFERVSELRDDRYGFAFKAGKSFIERKNAGWCGTPPISYYDYEGTWKQHDSIVDITVGYWGGKLDYKWRIISIDNNTLKVYKLEEKPRQ